MVSIRIFSAISFSHHSSYLTFFTLFDITSSFFSLFSSLFLPVPTLVHQQPSNPISKFSGPGQTNCAFPLTKLLAQGVAFWMQIQKILILKYQSLQWVARVLCILFTESSPERDSSLQKVPHHRGSAQQLWDALALPEQVSYQSLSLECVLGNWGERGPWAIRGFKSISLSLSFISPLFILQTERGGDSSNKEHFSLHVHFSSYWKE